jgi:hypothetical protein
MAILFDSGYGLFDSAAGNFDDGGVLSPTASVSGITLTAAAGTISENVSDTTQIVGQESTIFAASISATGIQNSNIVITGLELSSAYGNINEIVNDSVSISGLEALADIATISASGVQNSSIALNGIDLTAEYGSINEQVVDSIAISGIDLSISAANISASASSSPIIQLNGIALQATAGAVSATGSEIAPEEYTGGRFSKNEVDATAKVIPIRAIAYAGRVTPRGFTVINGGARVLSVQSESQISETSALGQLGIDEETLLMLLVA